MMMQKNVQNYLKVINIIDGFLVVLPNFGDEKGIADTLKLSNMNLPVLVMAYPDELNKLDQKNIY